MLKIITCILIICISTYIGYSYSNKYIKINDFYKGFYDFNLLIKNKISFSKETLNTIIKNLDDKNIFNEIIKTEKTPKFLCEEDIKEFKNYIEKLGKSDSDSQIDILKSYDSILDNKVKEAEKNKDKYKTVFIKIGFLIGLIISVAII